MSKTLNYATPSRPNGSATDDDKRGAAERFAAGADVHHAPAAKRASAVKPGEHDFLSRPHDREINLVNIRLTDREKGALKWLESRSPESMHAICKRAVMQEINRLLREQRIREIGPPEKV
jgi:hypothetical protein